MSTTNATSWSVQDVPSVAPDGREVLIVIVKATFRRENGRQILDEVQTPVRLADEVVDPDAMDSSIRYPGDVCVAKRGTDLIVVGDAVSEKPVASLDVAVSLGDTTVLLRVHGERLYYNGIGGISISRAAPFCRKPIVYERAYGGTSADFTLVEARNPVGRGIAKAAGDLVDTPAPQIEHPAHPITSARDRPEPVGLLAIGSHWAPRKDFVGTFDAAWKATRMPLMPLDYDARAANVAHPSLQLERAPEPGAVLRVLGMSHELVQMEIPHVPVVVAGRSDLRPWSKVRPAVDTILIEPEHGRMEMTFRAVFPLGRGKDMLREVRVVRDG